MKEKGDEIMKKVYSKPELTKIASLNDVARMYQRSPCKTSSC